MKYLLIIVASFSLTCCAPYKNQFSCPAGSGIHCKPVSYVNEQVDNGRLVGESKKNNSKVPITLKKLTDLAHNQHPATGNLIRVPEKTLRIWLNGFMDGADCYREEQYINKVVEKSHWEAAS